MARSPLGLKKLHGPGATACSGGAPATTIRRARLKPNVPGFCICGPKRGPAATKADLSRNFKGKWRRGVEFDPSITLRVCRISRAVQSRTQGGQAVSPDPHIPLIHWIRIMRFTRFKERRRVRFGRPSPGSQFPKADGPRGRCGQACGRSLAAAWLTLRARPGRR